MLKIKTTLKYLGHILGIGKSTAINIHKNIGLNTRKSPKLLKKKHNIIIQKYIKTLLTTEKKLKLNTKESIKFQQDIKTFRGIRNKLNYPCRGQRTHTNGKTKKKLKHF